VLSDSPGLSDLSSTLGAGGRSGARTSTPNLSKRKRSASVSSRDVKVMRKQIEGLNNLDLNKFY
jgi:hypothetical protein